MCDASFDPMASEFSGTVPDGTAATTCTFVVFFQDWSAARGAVGYPSKSQASRRVIVSFGRSDRSGARRFVRLTKRVTLGTSEAWPGLRWLGRLACWVSLAGLLGTGMAAILLALAPPMVPTPRLPLALPAGLKLAGLKVAETRAVPGRSALLRPRRTRFDRDLTRLWHRVCRRFPGPHDTSLIVVDARIERLFLLRRGRVVRSWPVSTSVDGLDQVAGSDGTPTGVFIVARKLGAGLPVDAVLRDQMPTGRIVAPVRMPGDLAASRWITTRILWLSGLQPGWNEGFDRDTFLRHIYIHGTANVGMLGAPASRGCVQMAPAAVIALFRAVTVGTPVLITPGLGPIARIPGPAIG